MNRTLLIACSFMRWELPITIKDMPKKFTTRNKSHPHYILKGYLERCKRTYTQMSKLKLRQEAQERDVSESGRARTIRALLAKDEEKFKSDWHKRFQWPFDDCYDEQLLLKRIREHRVKEKNEQDSKKAAE